jgi:NAD(P)-dependent dehydrogenase (short-subunit alcohol dehydrogenase family)
MQRLGGKVCIVTGAGAPGEEIGNGRAVALLYAREGGTVVVNDLDREAAERTRSMIERDGGNASVFVGDLSEAETARALVDHAVATHGGLHVVHNNIGISGRGTVVEASEELWDRVMRVNVKTMMLMGKFAVPALAEGGGGSIVNISSLAAIRPSGRVPYSTSKGAVIALTQSMALDHAADGVRVNCILPGPLYTPHAGSLGMSDELREKRRRSSPLAREGTAWDVANTAVFLASDESRYVTGVAIPVDGGVSLTTTERH